MPFLDLGCGTGKAAGSIGVDLNIETRPDIVADLARPPYPFRTSSITSIVLDNVLEHLPDVLTVMEELFRIAAPECTIIIHVPYFRSRWAAIDPTHRHMFTVQSMDYFDHRATFFSRYRYSRATFELEKVTFNERFMSSRLRTRLAEMATKYAQQYEAHFSNLYSMDELTYHLKVVK